MENDTCVMTSHNSYTLNNNAHESILSISLLRNDFPKVCMINIIYRILSGKYITRPLNVSSTLCRAPIYYVIWV